MRTARKRGGRVFPACATMCCSMEPAPADSPHIVTFEGSLRNEAIYAIHQFNMKQRPPQIRSHMSLNPLEGKVLIDWDTKICQLQLYGRTDRDPRNPAFSLPPSLTFCPGKNPTNYSASRCGSN
jgi:hypothetical protein